MKRFRTKVVDFGSIHIGGLFIAIMGHGDQGDCFQTEDEQFISLKTVIDMFNTKECFALRHIPKVFLVNMCRGKEHDMHKLGRSVQIDSNEIAQWDWNKYVDENFLTANVHTVRISKAHLFICLSFH